MANFNTDWKLDNYTFVGKTFDYAYKNMMNKLSPIFSEVQTDSIDYQIEGAGGYGELLPYDGSNLNKGNMLRGFNTIVVPEEYTKEEQIDYKKAKNDKSGETRKVGMRLGRSAAMTVYLHTLRTLAGAFTGTVKGGDGKAWAATDHPVASKGSSGRTFIADPDAGTFSNLMSDALSVSAIAKARTMASRLVTPDGLPFASDFDTLLVSPEDEDIAKKICGDNSKIYPAETADVNTAADLKYLVVGGGNDGFKAGEWAICDRTLMKEIFMVIYNTKPTVLNTKLDNPLKDSYVAYVDFALGFGDARPIIFSKS